MTQIGSAATQTATETNQTPGRVLVDIAEYVLDYEVRSEDALEAAACCLSDALGCGRDLYDGNKKAYTYSPAQP